MPARHRQSGTPEYVDLHAHGGELSLEMALEVGDAELKQTSLDQRGADLLIETPEDTSEIEAKLSRLRARGYRITLTHPERAPELLSDPARLERLADDGVLVALDADSLLGPAQGRPRLLAERLSRSGHAHALVFDAAADLQASELARPQVAAAALVGQPRARWLVSDGPAAIVAGRELPPMPELDAGDASPPVDGSGTPAPARLPVTVGLSRALLLVPMLAVAIVSFVVIRAQHGSGATILTQQRYAQRLTAADVAEVVRTAPDPKTHRIAIRTRCVPRGTGDLKNPWRCQLTYANRDHLQYTVTIFGNGDYEGVNQIILGPGRRQRSSGTISGCCINIP